MLRALLLYTALAGVLSELDTSAVTSATTGTVTEPVSVLEKTSTVDQKQHAIPNPGVSDENQLIFGIGLPRTGSHSLAEALKLLGFHGSNSCLLTKSKVDHSSDNVGSPASATPVTTKSKLNFFNPKKSTQTEVTVVSPSDHGTSPSSRGGRFQVDNSMFLRYERLWMKNPSAKFILCTRENQAWRQSVSRWDETRHDKDDMSAFETSDAPETSSKSKLGNVTTTSYLASVDEFFREGGAEKQLLILDVFAMPDDELWDKLTGFLEPKDSGSSGDSSVLHTGTTSGSSHVPSAETVSNQKNQRHEKLKLLVKNLRFPKTVVQLDGIKVSRGSLNTNSVASSITVTTTLSLVPLTDEQRDMDMCAASTSNSEGPEGTSLQKKVMFISIGDRDTSVLENVGGTAGSNGQTGEAGAGKVAFMV